GTQGLRPADHIVAGPGGGARGLEDDPAMDRENALPASGAAGEDEEARLGVGGRRWQHADARPVGVAKARRAALAGIKRRVDREGKEKKGEDAEKHVAN